jgi:hypothetical protein
LFFASGRTKIKGSSLIFGLPGGIRYFDLHTANRISLFFHLKNPFFKNSLSARKTVKSEARAKVFYLTD